MTAAAERAVSPLVTDRNVEIRETPPSRWPPCANAEPLPTGCGEILVLLTLQMTASPMMDGKVPGRTFRMTTALARLGVRQR